MCGHLPEPGVPLFAWCYFPLSLSKNSPACVTGVLIILRFAGMSTAKVRNMRQDWRLPDKSLNLCPCHALDALICDLYEPSQDLLLYG
jgi:hypothetical protein